MLQIEQRYEDLIIVSFTDSDWKKEEYKAKVEELRFMFQQSPHRIKMLFNGNPSKKVRNPPLRMYPLFIKDIINMKPVFRDQLDKTAIYKPSESLSGLFKAIFKVYKPVRPLEIFDNPDDAMLWLY